jgi:hypothetical protein
VSLKQPAEPEKQRKAFIDAAREAQEIKKVARVRAALGMTAALVAFASTTPTEAEERGWVLEVGPAAEWPLQGDTPNYGANIAIERGVIEGWLEIEFGMSGLWTAGRGELSWDLLLKKPFVLSPTVELMVGAGPSFSLPTNGGVGTASITFALDLMVWPKQRVGWFVEPTFSVTPGTGQTSFGATAGVLFSF